MIRVPRLALSLIVLGFGLYHAVLGLINLGEYQKPLPAALAISFYVVALLLALGARPGLKIKTWHAFLNLVVTVTVAIFMARAIDRDYSFGYTTWHIAGIATLMAITMVRGHSILAWLGVAFVVAQVLIWGGVGTIFSAGIVGAVLLVVAAQGASYALTSSALAANQFRDQALETQAATSAASAARVERKRRVRETLRGSLPMLELIVAKEGKLTEAEKATSKLSEAALRDQIRGRMLVAQVLVEAIHEARARGVEVQLLDDGGMDELSELERLELLTKAATEISNIQSGKVVIRSVAGENWKLTIAAIRKDSDRPDLFLRL